MNKATWQTCTKLSVLACSILMASCGGSGSDSSPSTPKQEAPEETPSQEPPAQDTPSTPEPAEPTPETPSQPTVSQPKANISGAKAALVGSTTSISAADSEGKELSYVWTLAVPNGSSAKLSSTDTVEVTFTPDMSGSYSLTLVVTDKAGKTATTTHRVNVTVTEKGIPITFSNTTAQAKTNQPFTFAQPFAAGEFKAADKFSLKNTDTGELVPLQTDSKATHQDGSLRHAIFSGELTNVKASETRNFEIVPVDANVGASTYTLNNVLASDLTSVVELKVDGKTYSMSLKDMFKNKPEKRWLDGGVVREWMASDSFKDSAGKEHPHLAGRINLRVYGQQKHVLVDALVENNYTYQAKPRNYTYDVKVKVNDKVVFEENGLNHLRRSRWHKRFWVNEEPTLHIAHDTHYLIKTKTVPHYDPNLVGNISQKLLDNHETFWVDDDVTRTEKVGEETIDFVYNKIGPMGIGVAQAAMPNTGGRPDIGPLPRWQAAYVLNQDPISKKVALGMGDLAGSWPIHFRDKNTGKPVSINDYPYISSFWNTNDTRNPATGKKEAPAACEAEKSLCTSPYRPDVAHQPSMAYIPYLLTGDYYYLEELQFWATYNFVSMSPSWRETTKGLFARPLQDRGQAWAMRTLGNTASITPDDDPAKAYYVEKLNHNIKNYHELYVVGQPNQYGAMRPRYSYPIGSPWMDDFFTWSLAYVYDLGFEDVKPIYQWKSKYPVQRLGYGTDNPNDFCWMLGASYQLDLAPERSAPMYQTIAEVYKHRFGERFVDKGIACNSKAMADELGTTVGAMTGYPSAAAGFPANMQPAIAVAADSGTRDGKKAWERFINRSVKPDYTGYPNWAVVPRKASATTDK